MDFYYQNFSTPLNIQHLIRKMNNSKVYEIEANKPKVFPYLEVYHSKNSEYSKKNSSNELSKLMVKMHNKMKKNGSYFHSDTLKYKNITKTNANFIEKVKNELGLNEFRPKRVSPIHKRSVSEHNKNAKNDKNSKLLSGGKNLVVVPSVIFPKTVRNQHERKDSLPECNIDIEKLDLPYVRKYIKNYNAEYVATKDQSINT